MTWSVVRASSPAAGEVLVEVFERALNEGEMWPPATEFAGPTERFRQDVFALFELPHKYVATGVRADRANPHLVRAAAQVTLPAGKHRILLRSRGPARLRLNGATVLETPFEQARIFPLANSGELPVSEQDVALDFGPGLRRAPPGNRDRWTTLEFNEPATNVVLEVVVGGIEPKSKRRFRPELGETVVAYALEGSEQWMILSPGLVKVPYTDADWARYENAERQRLAEVNAARRRECRAEYQAYWDKRRSAAREWLRSTPEVVIPSAPPGLPVNNPVDRFIGARIAEVAAKQGPGRAQTDVDFHRDVAPIFETHCYSCHQGAKVKGGLRLDDRTAAFEGGNADGPAIVPGQPQQSPLIARVTSSDPDQVMPAKGDPLSAREIALLQRWIEQGAVWPDFAPARTELASLSDDFTFVRRVSLDTIGVVPTEAEIATFLNDPSPDRRERLIDRLLQDPRWADHQMGYWLDVLAENPNLLVPTLNNTGPFRFWLHESFVDNKPIDLLVTELVRMEGSERFGGPAGFGSASQNDVPMAAKGIILGSAFLGVEMKCARCHDAPAHLAKQKDLFQLAAMLEGKPLVVPPTSSVPLGPLQVGGRQPLIAVTLQPGETVAPAWPFAAFCDQATLANIAEAPLNSRDQLAALITAPSNERFAQVFVNRIWQRLLGRGLVAELGDWEKGAPSHPQLLRWLGREFVRSGYDQKAIARLILNSHAYQRATDPALPASDPLFAARHPRRLAAEQLIDSFFLAMGKPFVVEPVNLDIDSVRTTDNALDLGRAHRAWALASTSNERDRPSLVLPRLQAVAEVMEVFGWRGARPDAGTGIRDAAANVLQPALLSNGTLMTWLTTLSDDHGVTELALADQSVETFVERLFLRVLTRKPKPTEVHAYAELLRTGYATRILASSVPPQQREAPRKYVGWSNHMTSEANSLRLEEEAAARRGDPPTARLSAAWRERCENVLWTLLNSPEAVHVL